MKRYLPILFTYITLVLFSGYITPSFLIIPTFGFGQIRHSFWSYTIVAFLLIFLIIFIYQNKREKIDEIFSKVEKAVFENKFYLMGISLVSTFLFFLLRNNLLNSDGKNIIRKFMKDVPQGGAHVTHDEIYELYIHSRFWFYTNRYFNWDVIFSYQVLSSLAGGVFIYLLLLFSKRISKNKPTAFFLLLISGGYMQLFFGDAENYTLTAVLIFAYFFSSYKYIKDEQPLIIPSSLLALAITFHLLAGFLLPSLAYLYFLALKDKNYKEIGLSLFSSTFIIIATLIFFHYNNLPIQNLFYKSHAFGHGGNIKDMLATPSWSYYGGILGLLFLLAPISLSVFSFGMFKGFQFDKINIHLGIASISMLIYMFTWHAALGIYNDWNLFANTAIPLSVFIARNALHAKVLDRKADVFASILLLFFIQTYARILYNHFIH